jgi:hypothetical protein
MINEWRKLWSANTPTSDKFPFGFMQLSTWDANQDTGFPAIRWHQTADHGYVPNEVMEVSNYCFLPYKGGPVEETLNMYNLNFSNQNHCFKEEN